MRPAVKTIAARLCKVDRVCVVFVSRRRRSGSQALRPRLSLWPTAGEYRNPRSRRTEIHRCKQMSWRIGSREPDTERDSEEVLFRPARRRDRRQRPTPQCLEVRRGRAVVSGWLWGIQPCSEMYFVLGTLFFAKHQVQSTKHIKPRQGTGRQYYIF